MFSSEVGIIESVPGYVSLKIGFAHLLCRLS